jgi:hypothetical protein
MTKETILESITRELARQKAAIAPESRFDLDALAAAIERDLAPPLKPPDDKLVSERNFRIGANAQMMNPPKPTHFDVFDGNTWLASLTYRQVVNALSRYNEMLSRREIKSPEE